MGIRTWVLQIQLAFNHLSLISDNWIVISVWIKAITCPSYCQYGVDETWKHLWKVQHVRQRKHKMAYSASIFLAWHDTCTEHPRSDDAIGGNTEGLVNELYLCLLQNGGAFIVWKTHRSRNQGNDYIYFISQFIRFLLLLYNNFFR